MRIGLVDCDTSHVVAFTQRLNHVGIDPEHWVDGGTVVAAVPGTSQVSPERIPGFVEQLRGYGVEILDAPEELLGRVDAVMVGAETVRVEGYGRMDPLAILVTRTARVPAEVGLLKAPENRVLVLTPSPDATLPDAAAQVSYLRAPLAEGVRRLRAEHGVESILCEGGPQLLGDLVRADVVDELHLVIAPKQARDTDLTHILNASMRNW